MKLSRIYFLVILLNSIFYSGILKAQTLQTSNLQHLKSSTQLLNVTNNPPIAANDTFLILTGCERKYISGNILSNDYDPDGDEIELYFIITPTIGEFEINSKGEFTFTNCNDFTGVIKIEYYIKEVSKNNYIDLAEVIIYVKSDCDCDTISDFDDIDDDDDGILDIDEGDGNVDSDLDGIPDSFDIDSDNDGITDNVEWQLEGFYNEPIGKDINKNGWDDAYDNSFSVGGNYYHPADSDNDGVPDFTDTDSDNDGLSDYLEGCDADINGEPDIIILNSDSDKDGLDDAFDIIHEWIIGYNAGGSCASSPDHNNNGIRDWRDSKNSIPGEDNYFSESSMSIYPNPSCGITNINFREFREEQTNELFLFSLEGKLLFEKTINAQQTTINLSDFDSGIYILKIQSNSVAHTERVIISR
ncbi:MAG: T9SS type A sorting domain-containing protein [Draconibacterium sp.]|nr:T9SS type A sorting domain-containing protein [Draconibacterium sp.]